MKTKQEYSGLEIAIIGMACRFPGALNPQQFWANLVNGVESLHFLSDAELTEAGVDEITRNDPDFVNVSSGLENKDVFDAAFFDYRPAEARLLNPEHRIFHECVWEAMEDAGYEPGTIKGSIGLFAGAGQDFNWKIYSTLGNIGQEVDSFMLNRINDKDYLTSLISYKLDLRGPSFSVNSACSTSLVAVHLACKALLLGETKMALAGGIRIFTNRQAGYRYEEGLVQSRDGHCRSFDKDSSGSVFSEGAGVVALKRLKDALQDEDHIYAIIKGSAINNDGKNKVGYTAPGVEGQAECIRMAQKFARVNPESIGYVETHGTATNLGDPIEIEALNIAFNRNKNKHCAIGSIKTNIGHLDAAAGIAGLIKTALSLKYGQLPPSLHFVEPNPRIDFDGGPFHVNSVFREWERIGDGPLRAGVSSLGIGGTNAHVILEEAPIPNLFNDADPGKSERKFKLLTMSARTESALCNYADRLKAFLETNPSTNLSDAAYTLQIGRKAFDWRLPIVFKDRDELIHLLSSPLLKDQAVRNAGSDNTAIFMFPGVGSQYPDMGKDLYESETVFREELNRGFNLLTAMTGLNYESILYPGFDQGVLIHRMLHTQPVIFIFEYALAQLLISYGILPAYMIGHSIGEYVAAAVSGVFSYEDALRLVVKRGELLNGLLPGAMISVAIKEDEACRFTNERISIAAVNGADQVVFSGDLAAIEMLISRLEEDDIQFVRLHASHAAHSPMVEDILCAFEKELKQVSIYPPKIPFVSNLTGAFISETEATSVNYWLQHMRQTVKFSKGIQTLYALSGNKTFIEVGAGHSLVSMVKQVDANGQKPVIVNLIRSIKEKENDQKYFTEKLGKLWASGTVIKWVEFYKNQQRRKMPLPAYAFDPVRFPAEVDPFSGMGDNPFGTVASAGGKSLMDWIYYPVWKTAVRQVSRAPADERTFLLFAGENQLFQPLRLQLLSRKATVIVVTIDDNFSRQTISDFTINPGQDDHFDRLLEELDRENIVFTDIIYGWGAGVKQNDISLEKDDSTIDLVYFGIVKLIQALQRLNHLSNKRILVVTDALHRVTGNEDVAYVQSLLLGLVNTLPQEYSVSCCNIDINSMEDDPDLPEFLAEEIWHNEGIDSRIVALRHGRRWIKEYQKNKIPVNADVAAGDTGMNEATAIVPGGVYLITGGLGNVGFILAKHLVGKYNATLIIIGRKKIADPEGQVKRKEEWMRRLDSLRKMGGRIIYLSADVSDYERLAEAIHIAEASAGPIKGVIHAAGIISMEEFELVEDITWQKTQKVLSPKIKGIDNLYAIFRDRDLDFVWITSSLASVLAGLSFSAYSSSNLYLEHFITSRPRELKRWKCIGLGEMVFTDEKIRYEDTHERSALKPDEITALFEWSLTAKDVPIIFETVGDLALRIQKVFGSKKDIYLDNVTSSGEKSSRPRLSSAYVAPETKTEVELVSLLEDFFGIQDIGIEDNFFELGGDSLKAMVFLKRIKKEFNTSPLLKDFFGFKNIRQIGAEIDNILWFKSDVEMVNEITI